MEFRVLPGLLIRDSRAGPEIQSFSGLLHKAEYMVKYTPATLKKLEETLKEYAYEVRYEKGNFRSGYCVLEARKVVMINKFSTLESRIQALIEIIQQLAQHGKITGGEHPGQEGKEDEGGSTETAEPEENSIEN